VNKSNFFSAYLKIFYISIVFSILTCYYIYKNLSFGRIKHFVSDSNEDITNPAKKFYEAVTKLANWYATKPHPVELTLGLSTLLDHHKNQTYPGLGTVKKLSIMHHLEIMAKFLREVN
jgi:hypothetical protein